MFCTPGNCPEWLTFIIVCQEEPGRYYALCQNTPQDRIYKLCGYCEELQCALASLDIDLMDLYDRSNLGEGEIHRPPPIYGFVYR